MLKIFITALIILFLNYNISFAKDVPIANKISGLAPVDPSSFVLDAKPSSSEVYSDNKKSISLNFDNIPTRELLITLGETANKQIIVDDSVTGNMSINLKNVSFDNALKKILNSQNLHSENRGHQLIIIANSHHTPSLNAVNNGISLYKVRYANANQIAESILKSKNLLSPNGSITADQRTNSLLIKDSPANADAIKRYLDNIDTPLKQVLIESRIVYADQNFARELGLKYGTSSISPYADNFDPGRATFAIVKFKKEIMLDLELSALESEGRGKIISNPKLVTQDRGSAYIEAGDEVPYQEKTTSGDTSISFKKAVLGLKVTPEVVAPDKINLKLQLNQDKVTEFTVNGQPTIQTRQIQTQVLVDNEQTIVLGGIYEETTNHVLTKIPLLGSIPIIGKLFQNKQTHTDRKELLIFVSPKIL